MRELLVLSHLYIILTSKKCWKVVSRLHMQTRAHTHRRAQKTSRNDKYQLLFKVGFVFLSLFLFCFQENGEKKK